MLLACIALLVTALVYIVCDPAKTWSMVFSWWRKTAPDDRPQSTFPKNVETTRDGTLDTVDTVDDAEEVTTPKANAHANESVVPTLELDEPAGESDEEQDHLPPPQFPASNSAQRASSMSKPIEPLVASQADRSSAKSSTMPPPPRPSQVLRPPPNAALRVPSSRSPSSGLRVPSNGPLPNRGPPQPSSSLQVHLTTSVAQPNPRKKIALSPGHSPLDWANLQRTHSNLAGVTGFQRVKPSVLKTYNGRKGRQAWASYQGKVYNITPYLPFHPGGEGELRRCAGKDGEKLFMEVHPWVNWDNMLEQCLVGILVSENDSHGIQQSPLEEMD